MKRLAAVLVVLALAPGCLTIGGGHLAFDDDLTYHPDRKVVEILGCAIAYEASAIVVKRGRGRLQDGTVWDFEPDEHGQSDRFDMWGVAPVSSASPGGPTVPYVTVDYGFPIPLGARARPARSDACFSEPTAQLTVADVQSAILVEKMASSLAVSLPGTRELRGNDARTTRTISVVFHGPGELRRESHPVLIALYCVFAPVLFALDVAASPFELAWVLIADPFHAGF